MSKRFTEEIALGRCGNYRPALTLRDIAQQAAIEDARKIVDEEHSSALIKERRYTTWRAASRRSSSSIFHGSLKLAKQLYDESLEKEVQYRRSQVRQSDYFRAAGLC